ncbi:MAG: hypothetical protein OXQ89_11780 [Rhodospirillaceae bacterium]|nr:hypothetical protein [Rhodospirillaceae bacterium]
MSLKDPRSEFLRSILAAVCIASVPSGCEPGHSPSPIGTVRLEALLAEFSLPDEAGDTDTGTADWDWPPGLEAALETVAERRRVVLFPAGAVIFGAPDYTFEVAFELARSTGRIGYFGELGCASTEPGGQP